MRDVPRETRKGTNASATVRRHAVQVVNGVQVHLRSVGATAVASDAEMTAVSDAVNVTGKEVGNADAVTGMTVENADAGPLAIRSCSELLLQSVLSDHQ